MHRTYIIIAVVLSLFLLTACAGDEYEIIVSETDLPESTMSSAEGADEIGVYVCGEVNDPGMYYFSGNPRVQDAVNAAGGITGKGVLDSLNMADYLKDCDKVYVPSYDEVISGTASGQEQSDGRVNLNTATKEELMTLPGIGESKAESIIEYRNQQGSYSNIDEITNISGIKEGVFQKIKDLIKV